MHVQFRGLIGGPDDLDELSLGQAYDLVPDDFAVLDSNLNTCWLVCRGLCLLRPDRARAQAGQDRGDCDESCRSCERQSHVFHRQQVVFL